MAEFLPTPPLPDCARAEGGTVPEMGAWFVEYYNTTAIPWNYRVGTRSVRAAYKGLHSLPALLASCASERNAVGRTANTDVVRLGAPISFGRKTQVVDLSRRRFSFGRDRRAAYRIPFFFIENGVVKAYFLQPRKNAGLNIEELGMVATVIKKYLLDTEFFGLVSDVEFVDLSAPELGAKRQVREFNLEKLKLWSERRLEERLSLIAEALDWAAASGRVEKRRRMAHRPEPDMPLFD
jgi:hypothetical protein